MILLWCVLSRVCMPQPCRQVLPAQLQLSWCPTRTIAMRGPDAAYEAPHYAPHLLAHMLIGLHIAAQALQAAVSAVRNARAEYGVELGRRVPATLHVADPTLRAALAAELPVLCALAKLDPAAAAVEARPEGGLPAADGRVVLVVSEGLEIALPLAGT